MFQKGITSVQSVFESIYQLYQSLLAKQPYVLILNVAFLIASFIFAYNLVRYIKDHNVFQKFKAKFKADIKMQQKLREEEYRIKFEAEGQFQSKNRMQHLNKKLIDSGISVSHPEFTAELFVLTVFLTCIIVSFVLHFTYGDLLVTAIGAIITVFAWVLLLELMITRNFKALEKETIKFMDLLKNFSHSSSDLCTMLGATVPYIQNPLKKNVEQCYFDIKATGNVSLALQRLCNRTNYKRLREVFEALLTCSKHNEEYENVINEISQDIDEYIAYRKEIDAIKQSNVIDILIMGILGAMILASLDSLLTSIDVAYYLFETRLGQIGIVTLVLVFIYSIYNVVKNEDR